MFPILSRNLQTNHRSQRTNEGLLRYLQLDLTNTKGSQMNERRNGRIRIRNLMLLRKLDFVREKLNLVQRLKQLSLMFNLH
jgi:hypothetical protein